MEEKHYLEMNAKSEKDRDALLFEFDKDNAQTINMIINAFRVLSDIDILKTTEYLNQFKKNLDWDSGFMLILISFSFYEIINIETEQKQQLLYEIKKLNSSGFFLFFILFFILIETKINGNIIL